MKTKMKRLAALIIAVGAFGFLLTCENGFNIVEEIETEVKVANDKFLVIKSVKIDATLLEANSVNINPGGAFKIQFDRPIDETSINSETISIEDNAGNPFPWNFDYNTRTNLLSVEPDPFLSNQTEYVIKINGVKGSDKSALQEAYISGFETGLVATGAVEITGNDSNSNPGYSISTSIDLSVLVNDAFSHIQYRFSLDDGTNWGDWSTSLSPGAQETVTIDISSFGQDNEDYYTKDGDYYVLTEFRGSNTGAIPFTVGTQEEDSIFIDITAPTCTVSLDSGAQYSTDTTADVLVTLTDNNPKSCAYRYWNDDFTTPSSWINFITSTAGFTSTFNGADNVSKEVSVEVRDNAGNPTFIGVDTINVDTVAPGVPTITTSATASESTSLRWDWNPGSGTFTNYERKINTGSWFNTANDYYTFKIIDKTYQGQKYTLYARAEDAAGNVSGYDSHSICYFPSASKDIEPDDTVSGVSTSTNFDWPDFQGADGYYFFIWKDRFPEPTSPQADVVSSFINPPTNAETNQKYYWKYQPYTEAFRLKIVQGTSPTYEFTTGTK